MLHARKMVLVPAHEDYMRQILPDAVPQLANLDAEIKQILEGRHDSADVKLQRYNQILHRYMKLREKQFEQQDIPPPAPQTQPMARHEHLSNEPAGEHALPEHQHRLQLLPFPDEEILEGIPARNLKSARMLLSYIKRNQTLKWNQQGEMIASGERYPLTHIIDLVHDFSRFRKVAEPAAGATAFAVALRHQNVPRESIGNAKRWKLITERDTLPFDAAHAATTSTPRFHRSVESVYGSPSGRSKGDSTLLQSWVETPKD